MLQRAIDEALGAADEDLRRLESRDTEGPEVLGRLKSRLLVPPFLPVAATERGSKWCDVLLHPFSRGRLPKGNFIDINTVVHRRALVGRHGGFDEGLDRLVDWDLLLRFTETREPQRLPVLAARCRIVDSQRVSDRYPYERNRRAVLSKWR